MFSAGFYKRIEKLLMFRITVGEGFRMPLDAQGKRIAGKFNTFGQAVRRDRTDNQTVSGYADTLVMAAVYIQRGNADDGRQQCAGTHIHCMYRIPRNIITGMAQGGSELLGKILIQMSAKDA